MSRPRARRNRHASRQKKPKVPSSSSSSAAANFENGLIQARHLEESGKSNEAIIIYEKIIETRPNDIPIIEELAALYIQCGHAEGAEKHFRSAIQLSPDKGFEKYAYLAQILGNTEEALSLAQRGVELIQAEASQLLMPTTKHNTSTVPKSTSSNIINMSSTNKEDLEERRSELREYEASAQCAVAEIALAIIEDSNDPSMAARMDVQIEQSIMAALAISDTGSSSEIEATISLANLRLSQGRKDEASNAMKRVLDCMSESLKQLDGDTDNRINEQVVVKALEYLPPMEIRIAIGKQLMEVELWNGAINVLSSIMWECDFNVEVWYMLAIAYWKKGDSNEARNALESTRKVLHSPDGYDGTLDENLVDRLLQKLGSNSKTSLETDEDSAMKD